MTRTAKTRLHIALAALLVLRAMVAPGYMAGGQGWPVQLCHEGLAGAQLALLFGHASTHPEAGDPASGQRHPAPEAPQPASDWTLEPCALIASLAHAALPGTEMPVLPRPGDLAPALYPLPVAPVSRVERPRARSPPVAVV